MSTLHVLSNPSVPVNLKNRTDPFSIATFKFIKYMSMMGWKIIHYGITGCDVECETVICLDSVSHDVTKNILTYNQRAGQEISKRKSQHDMIVCFYGSDNQGAAAQNIDIKCVEPSIGYLPDAVFSEYRVFVSYAQMHMFYGHRRMTLTPSWTDAVIPNSVTASEFEYSEKKSDYFLYFGRIIESKGIELAIEATKVTGQRLIIAGNGSLSSIGYHSTPSHVTMVGVCDMHQRRELMKNAKAILGPTQYVEPFGNMVIEGYMSGTPAITTDWGGFTETVIPGITGFRFREFQELVEAINKIECINPSVCRDWAVKNYEDLVVHKKFNQYFKKIQQNDFYR